MSIVKVRYYNSVDNFRYKGHDEIFVDDYCIVKTSDGKEFGTVVGVFDETDENMEKHNCDSCNNHNNDRRQGNNNSRYNNRHNNNRNDSSNNGDENYVIRMANNEDIEHNDDNIKNQKEAFGVCRDMIEKHNLDMKLIDIYYYFDRSKILFEYSAEDRVDFRELVKDLAAYYKTRIELRQIGPRDVARLVGGCGICGLSLCCGVIKSNFSSISIKMAKEQNMPLNQAKISGSCGKLMCCLNYEYQTYIELKKGLPKSGDKVIFNGEMSYIKEVNAISKKVLLYTEDKRLLYISADDIVKKDNKLYADIDT